MQKIQKNCVVSVPGQWFSRTLPVIPAAACLFFIGCGGNAEKPAAPANPQKPVAAISEKKDASLADLENAGLEALHEPIRQGQPAALAVAYKLAMKMPAQVEVSPPAPTTSDIGSWKRILQATAESFDKYQPEARRVALQIAGRMLNLTSRENVAANWSDLLDPMREVFAKGAKDTDYNVRATAMDQVALVWDWVPGRDLFTVERNTLAAWKGGMLQLVQPHLKDAEIPSRLGALRALAALPIDQAAAPGLELLEDKEPFVRSEVIRLYGLRSTLLNDDRLLVLLYDKEQIVSGMAETALKARGLTPNQILLGKTMVSPDPKVRMTVIAQLDESMDIDPAVWLARLVEDRDAEIRLKAVDAIARRKVTGELKRRLQIISETDSSDAVRKSAEKILRSETTAAAANVLPPLPSRTEAKSTSKSATIRAN